MKYKNTEQFLKAVQSKEFRGRVIVDNDQVLAYDENDDRVCNFNDDGPGMVLLDILTALGVKAEKP